MEWFSKLFKKQPKTSKPAPTLDGFLPIYTQFGTDIYASDVVKQCLKCIADEMAKLIPKHIRMEGDDPVPIKSSTVQNVLKNPNELMTGSEFIEKITWLLLMNYNAFILPTYYTWIDPNTGAERRCYEHLYPINPTQVDFIEDAEGRLYVKFWFWDGETTTLRYDDVIHIRYNYSVNEYMGGNRMGQPDTMAILEAVNLNREVLSGIAKALKASYAVNGIMKYNTVLDDGSMDKRIEELERKLLRNESGILGIDLKGEYIPIEKKVQAVDKNTLEFLDQKVCRFYGVSIKILLGDFTKEEYEAFYQKALEKLVRQMSEAFTKKLFTQREKAFGNEVRFYPKDLIFMNMSQKIEMVNMLSPTGALFENEKRAIFGLTPLPELVGKRFMSLNWIDANNANQYQVGKENVEVVDEEKEEI